MIVFQPGHF